MGRIIVYEVVPVAAHSAGVAGWLALTDTIEGPLLLLLYYSSFMSSTR